MSTIKIGFVLHNKLEKKIRLSDGGAVMLGRQGTGAGNELALAIPSLSRKHAQVFFDEGVLYVADSGSKNGTFINGRKIQPHEPVRVSSSDLIFFGGNNELQLVFNPDDFDSKTVGGNTTDISGLLEKKSKIIIGRSSSCDLTLAHPTISKQHASIERKSDGSVILKDLNSTNGTYVNGRRVSGSIKVSNSDKILIGRFLVTLDGVATDLSNQISVRANRIIKQYPNGYQGLKECSFEIPSNSLLAIMGPSGCGKSTLLKALCGDSPATSGSVELFGLNLNENYGFLKTQIGYVPQDDIVHKELTVEQTLHYAAKLRLPKDTSDDFITKKIDQVLSGLSIDKSIRNNKVSAISGGQRKRVSIAVEMLTDPMVLFLDEPTSPLDPQTIKGFIESLRNLAESSGTTVIMVTHKPGDLEFMDSVMFMAEGGYLTYFDRVENHLNYFSVDKTWKVYSNLEKSNAQTWVDKFKREHSGEPTNSGSPDVRKFGNVNFVYQYWWLTRRYLNIKLNDRLNSMIMVGQAPIIAALVCLIFSNVTQAVPFLMAISAIWFGANNAAREIVSEQAIFKRERMFNQGILPYIFSKITVLGVFAFIQSLLFTLIVSMVYSGGDQVVSWNDPMMTLGWMFYLSVTASLMGLLLSAVVDTAEKVMTIVPIALIPQIMLAGVVAGINNKLVEFLSYFTLSRWGTEGLSIIQEEVSIDKMELKEGTGEMDPDNPGEMIPPEFVKADQDTTAVAIDNLKEQFHPDYQSEEIFGDWTATLELDFAAIGILAIVFFVGIYISLKRKDPLKIK